MNDQIRGSVEKKFSSLGGKRMKIGNTQGQLELMEDQKYSRLDGKDEDQVILNLGGSV